MSRRLISTRTSVARLAGMSTVPMREAKVYRDAEWSEYRVTYYREGVKQAQADSHHGDRDDAVATANAFADGRFEVLS